MVIASLEKDFKIIALLRLNLCQEKKTQTWLCRTKLPHYASGPKPISLILYWMTTNVWT